MISGTDVQHQISDLQSMIAAGANAIIVYPLSPTALNRVIKQACAKNILVFTYDSTVTEPCAYNVSNITARYGANTAQWMANQMGGKGEVVINHGVAGTTVTKVYDEQALGVFKRYPGIKIVGDFYGNWNDSVSQEEVAKILAAHPNIDGIWNVDGSYGALQAVVNGRPDRLVTIAGQSNNGYRLMIADPAAQAKGLKGVSSSAGPAVGPYAFKVMMEVLTGKMKLDKHNVEYPLPWVEPQDVKICKGDMFADGCNTFPAGKVAPLVPRYGAERRPRSRTQHQRGTKRRPNARRHDEGAACGDLRGRSAGRELHGLQGSCRLARAQPREGHPGSELSASRWAARLARPILRSILESKCANSVVVISSGRPLHAGSWRNCHEGWPQAPEVIHGGNA